MRSTFQRHVENITCSYSPVFQTFNRTKGRLIKLNRGRPRPLQYMVKAAFMATKYESLEGKMPPGWHCRSKFYSNEALWNLARSQIDYILCKTPYKSQIDYILCKTPYSMSYLLGFVIISHRGSSIPKNMVKYGCKGRKWGTVLIPKPNPNTIVGAMVAVPW